MTKSSKNDRAPCADALDWAVRLAPIGEKPEKTIARARLFAAFLKSAISSTQSRATSR
jgi:hypothetical protein